MPFEYTLANIYLTRRSVKASLSAAILALNSRINVDLKSEHGLTSSNCVCLGRFHNSVLFLYPEPYQRLRNGLLVKVPLNRKRAREWDARKEFHQLKQIAQHGPSETPFDHITPVAAGDNPSFLVTSYYPSISLRTIIDEAAELGPTSNQHQRAIQLCANAGRWLGLFYASNQAQVVSAEKSQIEQIHNRIYEIESTRRPRVCTTSIKQLAAELSQTALVTKVTTRSLPLLIHGDFVPDNILVNNSDHICVIDPEPVSKVPFSDFFRFREGLILRLRVRNRTDAETANQYARAFSKNFRLACDNFSEAGIGYLHYVVSKVAHYHKHRRGYYNFSPRRLVYWRDKSRTIKHWEDWIQNAPPSSEMLWDYIENRL